MAVVHSLTIVIPTYRRSAFLRRSLERLHDQCPPTVRLVVLDNSSADDTKQVVAESAARFATGQLRYVCHPVNIGACANLLRAFEVPETEWVWVLGDDDEVLSDAIHTIEAVLSRHLDAACLSFRSLTDGEARPRNSTIISVGLPDFIEKLDYFCDVLLMSTNVYRVSALQRFLRVGYFQCNSFAPHVAMLLGCLRETPDAQVVLASEQIVKWNRADPGKTWDFSSVSRGILELLRFAPDAKARRLLARKIAAVFSRVPYAPSPARLITTLAQGEEAVQDQLELYGFLASQLPSYLFGCGVMLLLSAITAATGSMLPNSVRAIRRSLRRQPYEVAYRPPFASAIECDRN
jgi:abequosyltransferase